MCSRHRPRSWPGSRGCQAWTLVVCGWTCPSGLSCCLSDPRGKGLTDVYPLRVAGLKRQAEARPTGQPVKLGVWAGAAGSPSPRGADKHWPTELVPRDCCAEYHELGSLKQEKLNLTALETRGQIKVLGGWPPLEALREGPFHLLQLLVAPGITPTSASIFWWPLLPVSLLVRTPSLLSQGPPHSSMTSLEVIPSAETMFPNKGIFTGSRHSTRTYLFESESEVIQLCPSLCDPMVCTCQAPPSMGFSRQDYWHGLLFPYPGDLSNSGIKPRSPALQADSLPSEPQGKLFLGVTIQLIMTMQLLSFFN